MQPLPPAAKSPQQKKMLASRAQVHLVDATIFNYSPLSGVSLRGMVVYSQKMMKHNTASGGFHSYSILGHKLRCGFQGESCWTNRMMQGWEPIFGKKATGRRAMPAVVYCAEKSDSLIEERLNVLVIGGGGREHSLCYALQRSPSCAAVFCAPGKKEVGLVVVGPEAPLVAGLANDLMKAGIPTFGPSLQPAALEGSKNCMKSLCDKTFADATAAKQFVQEKGAPIVVKADGLAAGKGVIVAMTLNEAYEAIDSMLVKDAFGSAGHYVIIEEYLEGEEASFFTIADGENAIPLESAQDHKWVGDGDIGPNTGGMGAYSPAPIMTKELQSLVLKSIILLQQKVAFGSAAHHVLIGEYLEGEEEASFFARVDGENAIPLESAQDHKRVGDGDIGPNTGGMGAYSPDKRASIFGDEVYNSAAAEGCKFVGVLYVGLMIEKKSGLPKLFEYNVRFGDPECQVLMISLESDLIRVLLAACKGEINGLSLDWYSGSAMGVVMASNGYPGAYARGRVIHNIEDAENVLSSVKVFH